MIFFFVAFRCTVDFLDAAVQAGKRVPEMQEGVLLETDVNEHRLQAMFDIFDFALEDTSNDVSVGVSFEIIFFKHTIFEKRNAPLELFTTNDYLIASLSI